MAMALRKGRPVERWALPAQQERSRATRKRILDAAERVFAEKGYDRASLAAIASAAGCSVGAVYARFKDKDALFFSIAETYTQEARKKLPLLETLAGTSRDEVIRLFVLRTAESFRKHRGLYRAIIECGFENPGVMDAMLAFRDEVGASLALICARSGRKPAPNLSIAISVATQMLYGFLLTGTLNRRAPTRLDDDKAIAGLADAVVTYLNKASP